MDNNEENIEAVENNENIEKIESNEKEAEPRKKNWLKIVLIVVLVWGILGFVASLFMNDSDDTPSVQPEVVVQEEVQEVEEPYVDENSYLSFEDINLGYSKEQISSTLKGKGWAVVSSYKDVEFGCTNLEFAVEKLAFFQGHTVYKIVAGFDSNNKMVSCMVYFDVRPEVLEYQNFESMDQKIQQLESNCIISQGYSEYEKARTEVQRVYVDYSTYNKVIMHMNDLGTENQSVNISFYDANFM